MVHSNNLTSRVDYASWIRRQSSAETQYVFFADGSCVEEPRNHWANVEIQERDLVTDRNGNIIKMEQIDIRPCFGDIITFYRDGELDKPIKGFAPYSKCNRCKAFSACKELFIERVQSSEEIQDAMLACGRPRRLKSGVAYDSLVRLIIKRGPFLSINDAYDLERWKNLDFAIAQRAKAYQVRQREAARLRRVRSVEAGNVDSETMEMLTDHRRVLHKILVARSGAGCGAPPKLRHLKPADCSLIADVWLGAMVAAIIGIGKTSPHRIAIWLAANRSESFTSVTAADARVRKDLERIRWLNSANAQIGLWRHSPVLDALDGSDALRGPLMTLMGQC